MKIILGIIMIILGVILGVYVGVWVCFVGGIVDVINEIRAEHLEAVNVGIGLAKIFFAGISGWVSALLLIIPGYGFITWDSL